MLKGSLVAILIWSGTVFAYDFPTKPDPRMTTGDLCNTQSPDYGGTRYAERIAYCNRNVSREQRARIYDAYGVPEKCRGQYTIDHFIPLSIGGSNEVSNLWPEHKNVKATRQTLEQEIFEQLRDGRIVQAYALRVIEHAKLNPPPAEAHPCH